MRFDVLGCTLLCISAFLYAARYIAAGLYLGGSQYWSADKFRSAYEYVGTGLSRWALISLLLGILCFIVCFVRQLLQKGRGNTEAQIETEIRRVLSATEQAAPKQNEEKENDA